MKNLTTLPEKKLFNLGDYNGPADTEGFGTTDPTSTTDTTSITTLSTTHVFDH
jgi:hypothetical protein